MRSRSKRRRPRGRPPGGPPGDLGSAPPPSDPVSFAIAHDLRQPLIAAMLAVDGLGITEDPRLAQGHDLIRTSLHEALERIRALLCLAGLERHPFRSERVSLATLAGAAIRRVAMVHSSAPVEYRLIGEAWVTTDPALVSMVIGNLVENAVTHAVSPSRTIVLRIEVREGPDGAEIVIEDDGPGVAPELVSSMFEAYVRRSATPGTGLGLAIAARAARALNGRLTHEAANPHGARFRFIVPFGSAPKFVS